MNFNGRYRAARAVKKHLKHAGGYTGDVLILLILEGNEFHQTPPFYIALKLQLIRI